MIKLSILKPNPDNPRMIKDAKFDKLCRSITAFPKMLELRTIVLDENNVILGGNMRLRALQHLGFKEIPETWVKKANELTEEEKKQFIIKDNVGFGEWDWDELANTWDADKLDEWGVDVPVWETQNEETENNYSRKIEIPTYEPKNEKPEVKQLYNIEKTNQLIKDIEDSSLDKEIKQFLIIAAQRHIVFDYSKIADFYAHSDKETQNLMENSALVIIDFNKAIELGFVKLSEQIAEQYKEEYGEE